MSKRIVPGSDAILLTSDGVFLVKVGAEMDFLTASKGVFTDADKKLTSTAPTSGDLGYWNRTGAILSPATAGDDVHLSDSDQMQFGTGTDMAIYYDGTTGHVKVDLVAPSDLDVDCGTEKCVRWVVPVYEDLQANINNIRLPAANFPAWRYYACGIGGGIAYPFLGFDVGEYIWFDVQTHHAMKLNEALDNHIHFTLPNTTNIGDRFQFQLDVLAAGIDTQWAVPASSPFTAERQVVANDDTYHRLMEIGDIDASNDTVSTIYKCRLERIAATVDEYGSEVYLTFTDCHYPKDTPGSRQEGTK